MSWSRAHDASLTRLYYRHVDAADRWNDSLVWPHRNGLIWPRL